MADTERVGSLRSVQEAQRELSEPPPIEQQVEGDDQRQDRLERHVHRLLGHVDRAGRGLDHAQKRGPDLGREICGLVGLAGDDELIAEELAQRGGDYVRPPGREVLELRSGPLRSDNGEYRDQAEHEHVAEADDQGARRMGLLCHRRDHRRKSVRQDCRDYERSDDPSSEPQDHEHRGAEHQQPAMPAEEAEGGLGRGGDGVAVGTSCGGHIARPLWSCGQAQTDTRSLQRAHVDHLVDGTIPTAETSASPDDGPAAAPSQAGADGTLK